MGRIGVDDRHEGTCSRGKPRGTRHPWSAWLAVVAEIPASGCGSGPSDVEPPARRCQWHALKGLRGANLPPARHHWPLAGARARRGVRGWAETVGGVNRRSRLALPTTDTEDSAIAAAAMIGLSSHPVNG